MGGGDAGREVAVVGERPEVEEERLPEEREDAEDRNGEADENRRGNEPPASRGAVFRSVHRQMAPGSYLVLGASEQAEDSTNLFRAEFAQECYYYRPVARP